MEKPRKKSYNYGIWAEKLAILYLTLKGYRVIKWRYKTDFGEIDLIAIKAKTIVVIEVKARKKEALLEKIITDSQIKRINEAAKVFIAKNKKLADLHLRFDLIEIQGYLRIKHHYAYFG